MKITENLTGMATGKIFALASRENNAARGRLIVNYLQAKHIPAKPSAALSLFDKLAERVIEDISGEKGRIMVIGFAETATAIGAELAARIGGDCVYIHTTRESFPSDMRIALFSEEHSHATEQNLYSDKGADIFKGVTRIIFAEDELTTGKTILNFIDALKNTVDCKFSAASLINGMGADNLEKYASLGVSLYWLIKLDSSADKLRKFKDVAPEADIIPERVKISGENIINAGEYPDPRTGTPAAEYERFCERAAEDIAAALSDKLTGRVIDVIGTEECMYPALKLAHRLEKQGCQVYCHSTTRSPIIPSRSVGYPLFSRCRLESFYDRERQTFIYNLPECTDTVVVSDGDISENGLYSAVKSEGVFAVKLGR